MLQASGAIVLRMPARISRLALRPSICRLGVFLDHVARSYNTALELVDWVIGAAPGGVALVEYDQNAGGILLRTNPALELITGYSADDLEGMPAYRLIPEVSDEGATSRNEMIAGHNGLTGLPGRNASSPGSTTPETARTLTCSGSSRWFLRPI